MRALSGFSFIGIHPSLGLPSDGCITLVTSSVIFQRPRLQIPTMGNRFQCPNLAGNTNLPSVVRFKKFEWGLDLLGSNAGFITDYYHVTLDE